MVVEKVVLRMAEEAANSSGSRSSDGAGLEDRHSSLELGRGTSRAPSMKRLGRTVSMGRLREQGKTNDMGLGALLRFLPVFVRQNCVSRQNPTTLMEHRLVTVLFIIADMKVWRHCLAGKIDLASQALYFPASSPLPRKIPSFELIQTVITTSHYSLEPACSSKSGT
jgi:hypothetical protein